MTEIEKIYDKLQKNINLLIGCDNTKVIEDCQKIAYATFLPYLVLLKDKENTETPCYIHQLTEKLHLIEYFIDKCGIVKRLNRSKCKINLKSRREVLAKRIETIWKFKVLKDEYAHDFVLSEQIRTDIANLKKKHVGPIAGINKINNYGKNCNV